LYNKIRVDFLPEEEFDKVSNAISRVFSHGTAQVISNLLTKTGKQIPFLLEAHSFTDDNRNYLIGFGLDYRDQLKLEKDYSKSRSKLLVVKDENKEIKNLIETKKRELITSALEIGKTNKTIKIAIDELSKVHNNYKDPQLKKDLLKITKRLELEGKKQESWEIFKMRFKEIHVDFFNNLINKHPDLTKSEIKFCAYLYMKLSSTHIASILNVSSEAIKKTRYRIRKKIGLETQESLDRYISAF
jgi:DNA-binding CsgD family transcriptional regulator